MAGGNLSLSLEAARQPEHLIRSLLNPLFPIHPKVRQFGLTTCPSLYPGNTTSEQTEGQAVTM